MDVEDRARALLHEHGVHVTQSRLDGIAEALREAQHDGAERMWERSLRVLAPVDAVAHKKVEELDPGDVLNHDEEAVVPPRFETIEVGRAIGRYDALTIRQSAPTPASCDNCGQTPLKGKDVLRAPPGYCTECKEEAHDD